MKILIMIINNNQNNSANLIFMSIYPMVLFNVSAIIKIFNLNFVEIDLNILIH